MARQLVGPVGALVAILIIDGMHYFTFTATKFNHDVIQLPFWAMTGFAYWAALRGGRTVHWALLGFGLGMAVWAKYFVVVQAVPLVLFALVRPRRAQVAGHAGSLDRDRRCAGGDGAASRLAGAERFSSLCLC